jgi:ribonuclease BN (tRNA processing enzyme)
MIEAMTEGGFKRRGVLFAPRDALDEDPVVLRYLRGYLERIEVLEEGGSYELDGVSLYTPLRHHHSVETYGIIFQSPTYTISYIADTHFFDELCTRYRGELLIINVVRLEPSPYDHLSVPDAKRIIEEIKPKVAILTHFGMTMWRAKPWEVAKRLSDETGVRVLSARDGMKFDLSQLTKGEDA